jgi:uncharacterized membrane protein (TIGR01218 family)
MNWSWGEIMTSEIKRIKKNLTYCIVTIDGERYLMDTGRPFWKGLIPYSFWLFPHPSYKLDDDKVLNEVQEIQDDLGKTLGIGAGGAFFLTPLMEYFNLSTSSLMNGLILFLALTVILFSRFYYSKQSEDKIKKIVNLTQLETKKLIIRPSISYFLKFTLLYISFLGLSILSVGIFIEYGNMIALLCSMFLFFFLLIFNIINVRPNETYGKFANAK